MINFRTLCDSMDSYILCHLQEIIIVLVSLTLVLSCLLWMVWTRYMFRRCGRCFDSCIARIRARRIQAPTVVPHCRAQYSIRDNCKWVDTYLMSGLCWLVFLVVLNDSCFLHCKSVILFTSSFEFKSNSNNMQNFINNSISVRLPIPTSCKNGWWNIWGCHHWGTIAWIRSETTSNSVTCQSTSKPITPFLLSSKNWQICFWNRACRWNA